VLGAAQRKPVWMTLRGARDPAAAILSRFEVKRAPVPVYEIAEAMGITVVEEELPVTGILDAEDRDEVRIHVNVFDPPTRRRFTVAHELGHLMLHPLGVEYRDFVTSWNGGKKERQANHFAVDLLMPEWLVRPAFRWFKGDLAGMAEYFEVSQPAMEIRFQELYGRADR